MISAGGRIKKGAKSEVIVFWQCGGFKAVSPKKSEELEDIESSDEGDVVWMQWHSPVLKYYRVFHIEDCEGIESKLPQENKNLIQTPNFEKHDKAENVAKQYCQQRGVKLHISTSNEAYYKPSTDEVQVPLREQFDSPEYFYSTLFHELTHSTGHQSRLNRFSESTAIWGKQTDYSREELIAEIGAATALSSLGLDNSLTIANSASYLDNWAKYIKSDPMAFIVAAGRAEKAFQMIFENIH